LTGAIDDGNPERALAERPAEREPGVHAAEVRQ
jgi:hypothetical protein